MSVLVTGTAGFIGFHVARTLLSRGEAVCGIDNVNDYYDVALKRARLAQLGAFPAFTFHEIDVADRDAVAAVMHSHPDITGIIHLAAQAGVRYSLINPYAYVHANVLGQVVMLEAARTLKRLRCFVYASSSSVYGGNKKQPFSIEDRVDDPVSLYAATKRAGELTAISYAHIFAIPAIGLRFFTVYGPWGRPDMAAYLFADAILAGRPIDVFNEGRMARDFTYIDDIVAGVIACLDKPPASDPKPPCRLYNIGNNRSEELERFVAVLEQAIGKTATKELAPMQPGDVVATYADIEATTRDFGFKPKTTIEEGLPRFVAWYRDYHKV